MSSTDGKTGKAKYKKYVALLWTYDTVVTFQSCDKSQQFKMKSSSMQTV